MIEELKPRPINLGQGQGMKASGSQIRRPEKRYWGKVKIFNPGIFEIPMPHLPGCFVENRSQYIYDLNL